MTVVGGSAPTGMNPYGDGSGTEPDVQAQKNAVQGAYDTALQKLQFQREGTLQQYGFTSSGGLNDILSGKGANISFDPQYQNSVYGNAMRTHGNTLQQLRQQSVLRGLGDYGLGAQGVDAYQNQASAENEGIKTNLLQSLSGGIMDAKGAQSGLQHNLADITQQDSNYKGWAGSHYMSEGGSVRDPFDAEIIGNDITKGLSGINFHDSIVAGTGLGRVRDNMKRYLEQRGMDGFNSSQIRQLNAQYRQALVNAGLNPYDAKWRVGDVGLDSKPKPHKAAPRKTTPPPGPTGWGDHHGWG